MVRRHADKGLIYFAAIGCSLGAGLVAASEAGVCAILLGPAPGELERTLLARFPSAMRAKEDPKFKRLAAQAIALIEAPQKGPDFPLDVRGTVFQRRVWSALCAIPAGSTSSYSEIARQMGSPSAVRAVAGACAANILAVAIPCHRALRLDGSLSGYRWGVERKRELLRREGVVLSSGLRRQNRS